MRRLGLISFVAVLALAFRLEAFGQALKHAAAEEHVEAIRGALVGRTSPCTRIDDR